MTIKINFTLFELWGEKVKMKSSPLLLSAFTDRSLNYLCQLWAHSAHRRMCRICPRPACAVGQREAAVALAPGRARTQAQTAGASKLYTLYAKLCMDRYYQHVSGSRLLAKALLPLPRACSVEVHLIVLNLLWMAECSPGRYVLLCKRSRKKTVPRLENGKKA